LRNRWADEWRGTGGAGEEARQMGRGKWAVVLVLMVVAAMVAPGCGAAPGPTPTSTASEAVPIEYKLACIEAGRRVERNDFRVGLFDALLDRLEAKTVNNRSNIADIIVKTSQLAAEDGMPIGVLAVAQALDISIPRDAASLGLKLEEVAAAWLVLYVAGG